MNVLLTGQFGAAERGAWADALAQACPGVRWLDDDAARAAPATVRAAVVANPAPGRLQGLPALALIQSLWAGVDRLLADPTLPAGVPIARMVDPMMNAAMAETALAMIAPHLATAERHQNAALLATLMMLRAEALALQGRVAEAEAVRLDSIGWARYGFGADWAVRAKLREIAALSPLGATNG